jgi:hypothetical protein
MAKKGPTKFFFDLAPSEKVLRALAMLPEPERQTVEHYINRLLFNCRLLAAPPRGRKLTRQELAPLYLMVDQVQQEQKIKRYAAARQVAASMEGQRIIASRSITNATLVKYLYNSNTSSQATTEKPARTRPLPPRSAGIRKLD